MKIRKYVIEEIEVSDFDCTTIPISTVTPAPAPAPVTPAMVKERARVLNGKAFDDDLSWGDKLEFYEDVLRDILHVRCDEPSKCAESALKIKDLQIMRD